MTSQITDFQAWSHESSHESAPGKRPLALRSTRMDNLNINTLHHAPRQAVVELGSSMFLF